MLEVTGLTKTYRAGFLGRDHTDAVKNISFAIREGEIFGLFGESGCGKTTTSKILMGLLSATSGSAVYNGTKLVGLKRRQWKPIRREIQMIYQHPQMTFHPRGTIYSACAEPVRLYGLAKNRAEERELIHGMVERVGVSPDQLKKFPHEISGGQAQRISIARTLILQPKLLICDEPTSMLDISVQAQVLSMLKKIHREHGIALLYISHDLDVIRALCQRVAVMKDGEIVEMGQTEAIFSRPSHPYTRALLEARM